MSDGVFPTILRGIRDVAVTAAGLVIVLIWAAAVWLGEKLRGIWRIS